jgi:hypothetical protein
MIRALALGLLLAVAPALRGQGGILMQGIVEVEAWKTDTTSTLLSRNGGDPAGSFRLRLWSAIEPARGLFVYAHGALEGGNALRFDGPEPYAVLEQAGIRLARHRAFVAEAGKLIYPMGGFGSRVLASRNPLIGIPDAYLPVYPLGLSVTGERGQVDYRAAVLSLPLTHEGYVPDPDAAAHPLVGIGVTPVVGFRIGLNATAGPYLNNDITASQLDNREWQSYRQRVIASDIQYGFGHFDLRAEFALTDFEVPYSGRIDGPAGDVEVRATLTPRVFIAARGELNRYPFIQPIAPTTWISRRTELRAFEGGFGFRFDAATLFKATFSADHWLVTPENSSFVRPGGKAIAVQLSRTFDLIELAAPFRRSRAK